MCKLRAMRSLRAVDLPGCAASRSLLPAANRSRWASVTEGPVLHDGPLADGGTHCGGHTEAALSRACHYHPYELAPSAAELTSWISDVESLITQVAASMKR